MRKIDLNNIQVATSETARDINRRVLLNLIRQHQPISRADLARYSGLQRSTVSAITERLIAERWVREGAIGHLPRGRKPTFLHLNAERAGVIGVNLRPTLTTLALADLSGHFIAQESMPTADTPQKFLSELSARLRQLIEAHPNISYEGIGVSVPGRVDEQTQRLVFAPNLGWGEVDLKAPLEHATGLPVEIENAANACALAEIWFGEQHHGVRNLVIVTVSEGIGVGVIINGELVRGIAGEFGHVTLDENGPLCKCGNRGCWEVFASNRAAVRYYTQATGGTKSARNGHNGTAKAQTGEPAFEDLLRLAEAGNRKANEALEQTARHLGRGLAMLVMGLAPAVIVVVGEITRAWPRLEPILQGVVATHCHLPNQTRIVPAHNMVEPRLRGALVLMLQKHFGVSLVG